MDRHEESQIIDPFDGENICPFLLLILGDGGWAELQKIHRLFQWMAAKPCSTCSTKTGSRQKTAIGATKDKGDQPKSMAFYGTYIYI